MDDLISRTQALLAEYDRVHVGEPGKARKLIEGAPTVEPERKKGSWNTYYHSDIDFSYSCNQCGYSAPYQMIGGKVFQKKWNFCPNCGSDMREETDAI